MTTMKITPETCQYITVGTLRGINSHTAEVIEALFNSDLDVSFGDANRTMVDITFFMTLLEKAMDQQGIYYNDNDEVHQGYKDIQNVLAEFDDSLYIDLEN